MPSLLGIDSGLTAPKAVIFDVDGMVLSVARRRVAQLFPKPHFVERDIDGLWHATAEAIAEAVRAPCHGYCRRCSHCTWRPALSG